MTLYELLYILRRDARVRILTVNDVYETSCCDAFADTGVPSELVEHLRPLKNNQVKKLAVVTSKSGEKTVAELEVFLYDLSELFGMQPLFDTSIREDADGCPATETEITLENSDETL